MIGVPQQIVGAICIQLPRNQFPPQQLLVSDLGLARKQCGHLISTNSEICVRRMILYHVSKQVVHHACGIVFVGQFRSFSRHQLFCHMGKGRVPYVMYQSSNPDQRMLTVQPGRLIAQLLQKIR